MECRSVSMNRMGIDIYQRYILGQQSWYTPNHGRTLTKCDVSTSKRPNFRSSYDRLLSLVQNI